MDLRSFQSCLLHMLSDSPLFKLVFFGDRGDVLVIKGLLYSGLNKWVRIFRDNSFGIPVTLSRTQVSTNLKRLRMGF